ncbi:NAD(P)/FAD-dependent oxidoreductase [Puia dinghuensis]|uniref:FAD-dependent oxidoreductase n=1 Tax=Puia dinghuensis TaxID=1792502 RepID=A0A8J2UB11_9BACT|nr:FAD-dependent oxidoreductase [Puia dinghuensis]GGA91869.1 FAD-dependent oxidoreductase [Puia dinghuensis]
MAVLSVWEKESFFAPADIIIAGSGLVGLWSAYYLKKHAPSLNITIVDRGIIPTGASTRNAGFACFGSLTELIANRQQLGDDQLLQLVEWRYKGIKKIKKIFDARDIDYETNGGYELLAKADDNELRSTIDVINRLLKKVTGEQKTFRLQNEQIARFGFAGVQHLVENKAEGQLHSGKLCQALMRLVQSMGVTILNNIEVTSYEKVGGHLLLHTQHDFPLLSSQLLIATNAFARQLLPQLDVTPARGQVLVTSPIEGLPFKGTFHFEEGFYYFRNLGDRVLLGGARNKALEEENTDEMTITGKIQHELERFLNEVVLPGRHYSIEHRWSGIMGMGSEKMPILRAVNDHVFCAVRMSGMGVALAPVIGEKVAEMMTSTG